METEFISQQDRAGVTSAMVVEAKDRVAAILAGGGPIATESVREAAAEQAAAAAAAAAQTQPSTVTATRAARAATKPTRTTGKRTGTPNQPASAPAADALPSVNISLPAEVYAYFQKQADADERTLAKYMQRLVREVWRKEVQQGAEAAKQVDTFWADQQQAAQAAELNNAEKPNPAADAYTQE